MRTLEPINSNYEIKSLSDAPTEFEVQAGLFIALKSNGFDVRGEVPWRDANTKTHCRFDLVLYRDGRPSEIVEVRANPFSHRTALEDTRQGRRYRLFGVPVTFVYGPDEALDFLQSKLKERG